MKKVYGVRGLVEWTAIISCGAAKIQIPFSGGSVSGYGEVPATYTTENPMYQHIIENSSYFAGGRIFLVREMEGTGKYVEQQKSPSVSAVPGQAATASFVMGSALNPDGEGSSQDEHSADSGSDGLKVVEVSDIDDARDYLVENFSVSRSMIRSNVSVIRVAAENGIQFSGI